MKNNLIKFEGDLELNGLIIPCYVLEDGTRVLSGRGMQEALNMLDDTDYKTSSGSRLSRYLDQKSLAPFIYKDRDREHFEPLVCYRGTQKINGFEATLLADICDAFLEARKHITLSSRQQIIAEQCEILIRGFARVGIIALIDEATGYQYDREKDELQKILKAYVADEILNWQKTFHDNFYKEIFRLRKWHFTSNGINKRPGVVGKYTNQFVYSQLPKNVVEFIRIKTPKSDAGNYRVRLHQSLTPEVGREHLRNQLVAVTTLMNISRNWEEFKRYFEKKYGQLELDFDHTDETDFD